MGWSEFSKPIPVKSSAGLCNGSLNSFHAWSLSILVDKMRITSNGFIIIFIYIN